jgi:hypothetical protein
VLEEDSVTVAGEDALGRMLRAPSFFLPGTYSICLEGMPLEHSRRRVAFAVGYHYMRQLTNQKAPDALATGFGDLAEVLMFAWPSIMVKSGYTDRDLGDQPVSWAQLLQQRFAQGRIPTLEALLSYSTNFMEHPHYAEAWSFVSWLATDPQKLADLTVQVRSGGTAQEEIQKLYDVDEAKFKSKLVATVRSLR